MTIRDEKMNCSIAFDTDGAQHLTMCMSGFIIPVSRNVVEKCSGTDIMTFTLRTSLANTHNEITY